MNVYRSCSCHNSLASGDRQQNQCEEFLAASPPRMLKGLSRQTPLGVLIFFTQQFLQPCKSAEHVLVNPISLFVQMCDLKLCLDVYLVLYV